MEKEPKVGRGMLIPVCDEYSLLKIIVPCSLLPSENRTQTRVIIAIDVSGSMSGSPVNQAKDALLEFANTFKANQVPLTVIAFNSSVSTMSCTSENYAPIISFIQNLKASGGTVFKNVFKSLLEIVKKDPTQNYFIAFFTDGRDNDSYSTLKPHLEVFKDFIMEKGTTVALHTVGFGPYHDAGLLNKVISFGTKEGTFQYVTDSEEIPQSIGKLSSLIDFANFWSEIQLTENTKVRLNFQKDEKEENYVANVYADYKELARTFPIKYEIKINMGKEWYTLPVEVEKDKSPQTTLQRADDFVELVRTRLITIIAGMTQGKVDTKRLAGEKEKVDKLRDKLSQLMVQTLKTHDPKKMLAAEKLKECKDIFTEYFVAYNEAMTKGIVSNVSLAKLNNLAYKGVIDSRVARELAKRATSGQKYMEQMLIEIEETRKKLNFAALHEKYKDSINEFGHCAINYQTWLEALEEGDCLCLTYDAERDVDDIFDSSTVRIKSINISMLTSEAFVSAAIFASNSRNGLKLAEFGPSKDSGSMAKVLPNEVVNGILPLYICEEHWQVAKLRMRPMNAWTDTHDILAIAKHQPVRIPFLVLIKALDAATTEHKRRQFKWILDTCIALYNVPEHKELIMEDYKEVFAKYIEFPQYRTSEFVRSIPIFFTHFCLALTHGDIKDVDAKTFVRAIMEEILRRKTQDVTNDKMVALNFVANMLSLDLDKTAKCLAQIELQKRQIQGKTNPAALFTQKLEEKGLAVEKKYVSEEQDKNKEEIKELCEKTDKIMQEIEIPLKVEILPEEAKKIIDTYEKVLKEDPDVISVLNMAKELLKIDIECYTILKELGITTMEQMVHLVLQNSLQASNNRRKLSVNSGNYTSPFAPQEQIVKALEKLRKETVQEAKEYIIGREIKGNPVTNKTEEDAKEFASTSNPYKAAGIIMGVNRKPEFLLFLKAVLEEESPIIQEKLKMLFKGKYEGVDLFEDVEKLSKGLNGTISQVLYKYFMRLTKEEWYGLGVSQNELLNKMFQKVNKNRMYGHPPLPQLTI
eukprot:TRINITY_DN135052_c0_g1_i1.p1 TRINITY_DN135052_c0_g1~~TRINITY_DN135052_c0_g1_i1.p1  ORF type:complete len:1034 (+),score=152.86 TRINITY_DN135052_c0_g1_i1:8277-11378(+)